MIAVRVGPNIETEKALSSELLACLCVDALQPAQLDGCAVGHQPLRCSKREA
jgi:hypothetical protein